MSLFKKNKKPKLQVPISTPNISRWAAQSGYYWSDTKRSVQRYEGRAKARRQLLSLLSPRQRFCLTFLGRYTLRGKSGTIYKIEANLRSSHQWFYVFRPPSERYYFSLVVRGLWEYSLHAEIYTNLIAIHMALKTDEESALTTANWEHFEDKSKWLEKKKPFPLEVTYLKDIPPGKPFDYPRAKGMWGIYSDWFGE